MSSPSLLEEIFWQYEHAVHVHVDCTEQLAHKEMCYYLKRDSWNSISLCNLFNNAQ